MIDEFPILAVITLVYGETGAGGGEPAQGIRPAGQHDQSPEDGGQDRAHAGGATIEADPTTALVDHTETIAGLALAVARPSATILSGAEVIPSPPEFAATPLGRRAAGVKRVVLLGSPVAHSLLPVIQNAAFHVRAGLVPQVSRRRRRIKWP
jgi:hypothetical protein